MCSALFCCVFGGCPRAGNWKTVRIHPKNDTRQPIPLFIVRNREARFFACFRLTLAQKPAILAAS